MSDIELLPITFVDTVLSSQRNGGAERFGYDLRIFRCPQCGGPSMNTMMGVVQGACGIEWSVDEIDVPCPAALSSAQAPKETE